MSVHRRTTQYLKRITERYRISRFVRITGFMTKASLFTSEVASELSRAWWDSEAGQQRRREIRDRKIAELLAKFPVTEAEADEIRALLPPVTGKP